MNLLYSLALIQLTSDLTPSFPSLSKGSSSSASEIPPSPSPRPPWLSAPPSPFPTLRNFIWVFKSSGLSFNSIHSLLLLLGSLITLERV